ncbi:MAG TPA: carboxymuconolactone decarboxylase family protein [Pseudolabrys sp.]|nr:carboxymuconolactone decarboxylase family protein [Pseudolabrys sp.]
METKCDAATLETGRRLQADFDDRLALRDAIDPHFTKLWLDYAIKGLGRRNVLDERTRFLILIGQFTMTRNADALDETLRAALRAKVRPREALEVILQSVVYGGNSVVDFALKIFVQIAREVGVLDALRAERPPLEDNDSKRSMDDERKSWHPDDVADPRREKMMTAHDWRGVSTGIRLRPKHHLNMLSYLHGLDEEFADLWVNFTYRGIYGRGVLDDKTRVLCIVGNCFAVAEGIQIRSHMRGAMRAGASPREVLEVLFQSSAHFGMPTLMRSLAIFVKIMADDGRLAEIGNPPPPVD